MSTDTPFVYPPARKDDLVEDYHGTPVADPYRWLEDPESEDTKTFTIAQNKFTEDYLSQIPAREKIKARLTELWNYPHYTTVYKKKDRTFFMKNSGNQNQPVLFMREGDGEAKQLLNPNTLSEDGTIAVMNQFYTSDGSLLAYSLAESGSDWQTIHLMGIDTGEKLEDVIQWVKFTGVVWSEDKRGYYYTRLPTPGTVPQEDQNNYRHVCWHSLGTPQEEDVKVFQHEEKTISVYAEKTEDEKYLILSLFRGTDDRNGLYYREFEGEGDFVRLFEPEIAEYSMIGSVGDRFFIKTDSGAPRGRIVAVDLNKPQEDNWQVSIPESEDAIHFAFMINNQLVVLYLHDAYHVIKVYSLEGEFITEVPLPAPGTVTPLSGGQFDEDFFFCFASFLYPDTIFRYHLPSRELSLFAEDQGIDFDTSQYTTHQVFYTSKDGTQVPLFLTHKKGIELNGNNPTILYGYGGFNIAQTPFFKVWNLTWIEMGGVFALANLRGGSEYGEEWHRAGMLENKQNVFDDMHSAAEWLIENKYTRTEKLAIEGRSNGGLLTTACMLQRPDLYGAVLSHVPVTDMLRFQKFTVGHFWCSDYGNAEENPEHFKFLYAYSPLHNVKEGVVYPPVILTTADTDDRVVPSHSKKFAATLQNTAPSRNPTLLRVEMQAGHGLGKPITKQIEERADVWAFLVKMLGMEV